MMFELSTDLFKFLLDFYIPWIMIKSFHYHETYSRNQKLPVQRTEYFFLSSKALNALLKIVIIVHSIKEKIFIISYFCLRLSIQ